MTSVDDVAGEAGVGTEEVLAACHELGIVASSGSSGLSSAEHARLRDALGASPDLPPVVAGSTERRPSAPAAPDPRSLQERHAALRAESRTRRISPATAVRIAVYSFLVVAIAVAVVVLRGRSEDDAAGQGVLSFTDADEGTCVDLDEAEGRSQVTTVACATPHDAELYEVSTVDGGADAPFPGGQALTAQADRDCGNQFAPYVGRTYDESALDVVYLVPTPQTWSIGDRSILCLVEDPEGPLTGSVEGADR